MSLLTLTLPDGATREVAPGTLPKDVVASIGPRLLLAAVAVSVDGEVQDLITPLRKGGATRALWRRCSSPSMPIRFRPITGKLLALWSARELKRGLVARS